MAELILTAPPRESEEQGMKLYGPLAQHITQLIGQKVVYHHPRDWLRYQRDIRRDKFDIIFDGPHFLSWRILHLSHTPLVKLPGTLDFYFITHADSKDINSPEDLVLKKVCAIPPPNLTSLVLLSVMNSPIREPLIKSVKGGMKAVYKDLHDKKCVAAVIRQDYFNKKMTDAQRAEFKIIYTSKKIPNQGISASQRIDKVAQDKIRLSLTQGEGVTVAKNILKRFAGKKVVAFDLAKKEDFVGQNELLEGIILGW